MRLKMEAVLLASGVAWIECPDCDDYWCRIHGEHVHDCLCPSVDEWLEDGLNREEGEG